MTFWTFNQNNSGGTFAFNKDAGITHYVIIEASSRQEAIDRAVDAGIYFDGVSSGMDCGCCGDRWSEPWDDESAEAPEIYGQNIREDGGYCPGFGGGWMDEGHEVCIHPLQGPLEWYGVLPKAD